MAIVTKQQATLGVAPACRALAVPRPATTDGTRPKPRPRAAPSGAPGLAAGGTPARAGRAHRRAVADLPPAEVYATLLDEGTFLCSIRTMYRVLQDHVQVQVTAPLQLGDVHDHSWLGAVASNSGAAYRGNAAAGGAVPGPARGPGARDTSCESNRGMSPRPTAWHRPRRAAGRQTARRCARPATCWRSSGGKARGNLTGRRGAEGFGRVPSVVAGRGTANCPAGRGHAQGGLLFW